MASLSVLDKEYSPSLWSKRFPTSKQVLRDHVRTTTAETNRNLEKYKCKRNFKYGNRKMERMDIYYENEEGTPIVIYIHGGYWQELTKDQSGFCVSPLIENNCRIIVVDYDLCPDVTLQQIVDQIRRALKTIFEYAGKTDASSISIVGHSAGAHLAILTLQKEFSHEIPNIDKLNSVFLISGIYDLTDLRKTVVNRDNLLSLNEDNVKIVSPIEHNFVHLKKLNIAFYIYVAENDSPTFIKQSTDFHDHLKTSELESNFRIITECDHFDIVDNLAKTNYEIMKKILERI